VGTSEHWRQGAPRGVGFVSYMHSPNFGRALRIAVFALGAVFGLLFLVALRSV